MLSTRFRAAATASVAKAADVGFQPYKLLFKSEVSPNSALLRFGLPGGEQLGGVGRTAPTGVKVQLPRTSLEKSYSPVSHPATVGSFDLLVKAYPLRVGGGFGAFLCGLEPGETAPMKVKPASLSLIGGGPLQTNRWTHMGLVACGTGIAPFIQIIRQLLEDPSDTTEISLVFANRTEEDILLHVQLESWTWLHGKRFRCFNILSQPSPRWPGAVGRVDTAALKEHLPQPGPSTMLLVCGTDGFVETVCGAREKITGPDGQVKKVQGELRGILSQLGYDQSMVHKF